MERVRQGALGRFLLRLLPQNGLTRRWLRNSLLVIVAFLLVLQLLFSLMLRFYYYDGVENTLDSRARLYHRSMESYLSGSTNLIGDVSRDMVENFSDKDRMELQVVDTRGRIRLSSSGFVPRSMEAPDYARALTDAEGIGRWQGRTDSGERVMALCMVETNGDGTPIGGFRYVVSLTEIDRQILLWSFLMLCLILVIFIFVFWSGMYFINSIVAPVSAVNKTARRIAMGEYDARLEKRYDDEIGELCDTINYMAGEISNAEKMKNEFISSVSHELRTPLTAIQGWTETLQNAAEDRELTAQGLSVIGKEARRLTGLVEELLDFSRMEGGHIHLRSERLDLQAELAEAVFLLQDKAARNGVTLHYVEHPDLPTVNGDSARIKQVFVNLLDNAVKYSRTGDRVRVEAAAVSGGVQVVVSDTGVGIPADKLPLVTKKFYQAEPGTTGAGIGLALSEEILRLHGGRMEIDSEPQVGTTVTVWLPQA